MVWGMRAFSSSLPLAFLAFAGCGTHGVGAASHDAGVAARDGGGGSHLTDAPPPKADASACNGSVHTEGTAATGLPAAPALSVPAGFTLEVIASLDKPRELAALPNGDLLVGSEGTDVWLIPNAEGAVSQPVVFTSAPDTPVQGVAFDPATCSIAIGSQHGIYVLPYKDGQTTATLPAPASLVRQGNVVHTASDTDTHISTSVAFAGGRLYASVGSSCNACVETDPTRATVQEMNVDGTGLTLRATRIRNGIALAANPATETVWVGGAGQDNLTLGHPYEYFDGLTLHSGVADYGWPDCEENQHAYVSGSNCSGTVQPLIELPAYSTLIGAAFYPADQAGAYAFGSTYRGGLFITAHGSWHTNAGGTYYSAPRVVFVKMSGDSPSTPANWGDPTVQWTDFVSGFQLADGMTRIGRPTGIAVGPKGSLFIADDAANLVYRVR